MSSFQEKAKISLFSAVLFAIVSTSQLYNNNIPAHTGAFFGLSLISMSNVNEKLGIKLKHSFYGSLIFFFVSNPVIYSLTKMYISDKITNESGQPTMQGIAIHSAIYFIILMLAMHFPSDK